ncbi:hypothetical protein B0H13DRAFT_1889904 [Mycena leptocephala]|nr:hypothetical protein B0H13DRAFT_1889904 [Mycena leptocephala]
MSTAREQEGRGYATWGKVQTCTMTRRGGRIWWLSRAGRSVVGKQVTDKYCTVLRLIRDHILIVDIQTTASAILGQLVGIAPTLIAVRVGLGQSVDNVESFVAAQMRSDQSPLWYRMAATSRDSTGLPKVCFPAAGDDNHGRGRRYDLLGSPCDTRLPTHDA